MCRFLLTCPRNMLKEDVYIQLCEHSSKNILAEEQYGFRSKSTTNNVIYKLTDEILKTLNKLMVGGIFCDLDKVLIALTIKSYYLL